MRRQNQEHIDAIQIPGVMLVNGQAYGEAGGDWFPVRGALRRGTGFIPVLDIPMMDEQPSGKVVEA